MAIDIPFDGIDPDSLGGFDLVAPGWAHAKVVNVEESTGDKCAMAVELEVLRHSRTNQVGRVHRELFYKTLSSEFPRKKFMAFALATELVTVRELKAGPSGPIEYTHAVGKQVAIKLQEEEYNGQVRTKMEFDKVFHPASKKANDCPLDMAAITAAGITLPPDRNPDGAVGATTGGKKSSAPDASKQAGSVADVLNGIV